MTPARFLMGTIFLVYIIYYDNIYIRDSRLNRPESVSLARQLYYYWASEASPTLGCSIEISRDIYYIQVKKKAFKINAKIEDVED